MTLFKKVMKLQVFLKFYFLLIIALKIIKTETVK